MVVAAVLIGSGLIASQILVYLMLWRYLERQKAAVFDSARAYFESPDGNTPSQFASLVEVISGQFSQKLVATLKSTFMGVQSGDHRAERGPVGELAQDMAIQESPVLGSILASFPSVAKRLRKNPELLPFAQSLLGKLKLGAKVPDDGTGAPSDYGARLAKYR